MHRHNYVCCAPPHVFSPQKVTKGKKRSPAGIRIFAFTLPNYSRGLLQCFFFAHITVYTKTRVPLVTMGSNLPCMCPVPHAYITAWLLHGLNADFAPLFVDAADAERSVMLLIRAPWGIPCIQSTKLTRGPAR